MLLSSSTKRVKVTKRIFYDDKNKVIGREKSLTITKIDEKKKKYTTAKAN